MNYLEAKELKGSLEDNLKKVESLFDGFNTGNMGLVSDDVLNSDEYIFANTEFKKAFKKLRDFNAVYVKQFKKEIRSNRRVYATN
ncbi:MAG: hypothetical protein KAT04_12955 [Methylococcales bacterium]|nr:hypothetical protein [Methylococcales bacterium]